MTSVEHLVVEFFLLEIGQLRLELVIINSIGGRALSKSASDFVADGVLLLEVLPERKVSIDMGMIDMITTYMVASTLSIVRPP